MARLYNRVYTVAILGCPNQIGEIKITPTNIENGITPLQENEPGSSLLRS